MSRWGMLINLRRCIGCSACAAACGEEHDIPRNIWRRVHDCGVGGNPSRQRLFLHMSCMHCVDPPCLSVCPTKATLRRPDGIICIDATRCVGCAYCIVACPYRARSIFSPAYDFETRDWSAAAEKGHRSDRTGVCTKCDFCSARIDSGLERGLQPGIDADATPICVITCSSGALHFGDIDDPLSGISQLIREHAPARLQEALGTGPSIWYLLP